ncbi:hypothetical protein [Komagataeibacter oboediens]|uniref:hypothetical protein n=1 Tax=Komagataeibacter oboediens TaxID=65958 RepID=UPI0012F4A71C|nr:hypothetical protein [Komagataeibacter oboediens]
MSEKRNVPGRRISQHGKLQFTSNDLSPMEIARRLATVGVYVTDISVFAPFRADGGKEFEF